MSILSLVAETLGLTPVAGQVEYDGQYYGTDNNGSRGQFERLVRVTSQTSTSGTAIDFTGIPAWAKRITVMFNGVSTSGGSPIQVQLGSGAIQTTGYASGANSGGSSSISGTNSSTGLVTNPRSATDISVGTMTITNFSSTTWVSSFSIGLSNSTYQGCGGGSVTLSGALDRIRITTVNGTDTFDAGSINIMYEG